MRWLVIATLVLVAACVVLIAVGGPTLVIASGIVAGGTAFVLLLAIAFYAVGRSEDRERADREARARARAADRGP